MAVTEQVSAAEVIAAGLAKWGGRSLKEAVEVDGPGWLEKPGEVSAAPYVLAALHDAGFSIIHPGPVPAGEWEAQVILDEYFEKPTPMEDTYFLTKHLPNGVVDCLSVTHPGVVCDAHPAWSGKDYCHDQVESCVNPCEHLPDGEK